nr:hypothetical protein [Treponema endosymbiont of Eucomonympha sp.]
MPKPVYGLDLTLGCLTHATCGLCSRYAITFCAFDTCFATRSDSVLIPTSARYASNGLSVAPK